MPRQPKPYPIFAHVEVIVQETNGEKWSRIISPQFNKNKELYIDEDHLFRKRCIDEGRRIVGINVILPQEGEKQYDIHTE